MAKEKTPSDRLDGMKEICKHLGRSESTVLEWNKKYDFPIKKLGGRWLAHRSTLDKWLKIYNEN